MLFYHLQKVCCSSSCAVMFLSISAILIISISTALSCFSRLSNAAAAAVPLTSEGSIIPAQLQQQSNNKNATQSPNTTDMINGLPSIDTIPIANSTYATHVSQLHLKPQLIPPPLPTAAPPTKSTATPSPAQNTSSTSSTAPPPSPPSP